ncbi:VOC family protein [Paenirhodobacter populi]|uniref:VOC family protein n=1 Tax=Paenirhodobacter populi TaxID=2306993 RepID=UPI0019D45319|nr:VOC family protein [Sinirhodobacter populi]
MLSHIILGARDLDRQTAFHDAVLPHLCLVRREVEGDGGPAGVLWTVPGQDWPQFWTQLPFDGHPATPGNSIQVSFRAESCAAVAAAWNAAIHAGGTREGAPGMRLNYAPDYHGTYARDPEGNGGNKPCLLHMHAFTDHPAQPQPSDAPLRPDQTTETHHDDD